VHLAPRRLHRQGIRKLRIAPRSTTRKFFLHPHLQDGTTGVRFTPPAINGIRRVVFRSTGTKEIAAAKRIAAQIIESFWTDAGRDRRVLMREVRTL